MLQAVVLLAQKKEVEDQLAEERTRTQQLLAEKQDIESHAARKLDPEEAERGLASWAETAFVFLNVLWLCKLVDFCSGARRA